jgi:hypothetical protein
MNEAADAIEELSGLVDHYGGETGIKNLQEYASKYWDLLKNAPHWIPVTERLPEEAYACLAIVWDNNPYSGDTFLNYYPEFVGYGGGSWNDYNGDEIPLDVVYWMKLPQIPEPPKEEK